MKLPLIHKEILALSIPAIVTNITTPLLGLVDVTITGHMGSAIYIAAIAIGGNMFNMLYWLFAFLRMGTSGMTAQAFGAQNFKDTTLTLYRALVVALFVGIAMVALQVPLGSAILNFLNVNSTTSVYAWDYFSICIWGAPAFLGTFALSGWFLGMQDSKATMYISILINIVNIATSLTLVYLFDWGLTGVATGTLTAQWVGFIIGLLLCLRSKYNLTRYPIVEIFKLNKLKRFFSINVDIFFRTFCLVAVTLWFTRTGAQQSDTILAVNTLLMQLFLLFSFFMDGFAFAGEALAGRFIGECNTPRLKECIKALMLWGAIVAIIFTCIYAFGGEEILMILSSEPGVIEASKSYYYWAAAIPLAGFVTFTWDGIFIGATRTRAMLLSMFIASVAFFGLYFALFDTFANHAVWLAFISYLIIRGVILTILSPSLYKFSYYSR